MLDGPASPLTARARVTLGALRLASVGCVMVVLVAGCAADETVLDADAVTAAVVASVAEDLGLPVTAIGCPPFVELVDGATVVCAADVAGATTMFDVELVDAVTARLSVTNRDAIVELVPLESEIAAALSRDLDVDVEVDCGGAVVRPTPPGGTFECEATSTAGDRSDVVVEVATSFDITWHLAK